MCIFLSLDSWPKGDSSERNDEPASDKEEHEPDDLVRRRSPDRTDAIKRYALTGFGECSWAVAEVLKWPWGSDDALVCEVREVHQ